MIRRLFWLTLGAALGVTGYRRVTALARSMSPAARAGDVARFAADVREGMALYKERHHRPEGPTLESHRPRGRQHGQSPGSAGPGAGRTGTGSERTGTGADGADPGAGRAGSGREHSRPEVKDGH